MKMRCFASGGPSGGPFHGDLLLSLDKSNSPKGPSGDPSESPAESPAGGISEHPHKGLNKIGPRMFFSALFLHPYIQTLIDEQYVGGLRGESCVAAGFELYYEEVAGAAEGLFVADVDERGI